jgi:hypothetical protein
MEYDEQRRDFKLLNCSKGGMKLLSNDITDESACMGKFIKEDLHLYTQEEVDDLYTLCKPLIDSPLQIFPRGRTVHFPDGSSGFVDEFVRFLGKPLYQMVLTPTKIIHLIKILSSL